MTTPEEVAADQMKVMIEEANVYFDQMTQDRHDMGAEKYGSVNFLEVDSIQMALEEVADLANYARYTFIKLRLLQQTLGRLSETEWEKPKMPVGPQSFVPDVPTM